MSCGVCKKVRAHLPAAIRARLEQVEAARRAKKVAASITVEYPVSGGKIISTPLALTDEERARLRSET